MNNKTISSVKCILYGFGLLVLALPAQGASFDCGKAATKVEKMICADAELSGLDERVAKAYTEISKTFAVPDALRLRQEQWIKHRNGCAEGYSQEELSEHQNKQNISICIKEDYEQRLNEIAILAKADLPCPELPLIKSEGEKALCLKRWLAKHPMELNREHMQLEDQKYCASLFQAFFSASSEVQYVEPVLRTEDPMHPELERYRHCGEIQPDGLGYDYEGVDQRLAHGFRLYRLDLGGDSKNRHIEYLYEEQNEMGVQKVSYDYVRVDLKPDSCYIKDLYGVTPQEPRNLAQSAWGLNAIISYQGRHQIFDLDGYIGLSTTAFDIKKSKFSIHQCYWQIPRDLLQKLSNEGK